VYGRSGGNESTPKHIQTYAAAAAFVTHNFLVFF
jgi:hypothetical protein